MTSINQLQHSSSSDEREEGTGCHETQHVSRPQSLDHSNRSDHDLSFVLHYHGSCTECHHFHRHVPINIPRDDSQHIRFHCERCDHPLFGLGRSETQNTLASQDSFPIVDGAIGIASAPTPCSNRINSLPRLTTASQPNLRPIMDREPLSAIDEQNSPAGRSRSTSEVQPQGAVAETDICEATTETGTGLTRPSAIEIIRRSQDISISNKTHHRRSSRLWDFIYRVVGRMAERLGGKPRDWRFLGLRLRLHLTCDHPKQPMLGRPDSSADVESASDPRILQQAGPLSVEPTDVRDLTSLSRVEHDSMGPHLEREEVLNGSQDSSVRQERLRIYRREKTIRKLAMQRTCNCDQDCHCKQDESGPSSVGDGGTPSGSDWVPISHLGRLIRRQSRGSESDSFPTATRPDPLSHIGGILPARRRLLNTGTLSSASARRQTRGQDTETNASSLSLQPSRPIFPGRSLSASALPPSPTYSQASLGVTEVLRRLEILHQTRTLAAEPNTLAWLRNGTLARAMFPDRSAEIDGDTVAENVSSPGTTSINDLQSGTVRRPSQNDGPGSSSSNMPLNQSSRVVGHDQQTQDDPYLPNGIPPHDEPNGSSTPSEQTVIRSTTDDLDHTS